MTLDLDGELFNVVEFQHVKPGKGPAFVRTKIRRLKDGAVIDRTFRAGEKVEQAMMETNKAVYSYMDGSDYVFMNSDTYEQYNIPAESLDRPSEIHEREHPGFDIIPRRQSVVG